MKLETGFSIEANRSRCLKAAGIALGCVALLGLLSWDLAFESHWILRIKLGFLMLLLAVAALLFALIAYVRWLDWMRGNATPPRSDG
jgi:hypothetical protein